MSDGDFIQLQDSKVSVNLETLASVNFVAPAFRQLTDFSISTLIYHGYMSSIFHGKVENTPVIIEACSRIPYRLVCREIKLLNDLNINNIVKIAALTRNSSLGIICLAYKLFDFQPWTEIVPQKCLPNLLFSLLTVLSEIHANDIFHGWVCRSSVYVNPDFKSIILGSFHAAAKIGDPAPLIPDHPCAPPKISEEDRRPDDIYSAALWFLSFYKQEPQKSLDKLDTLGLEPEMVSLLQKMVKEDPGKRITAKKAMKKLQSILNVS